MTFKNTVTLHNLLILLCVLSFIALGYKGYQIHMKSTLVSQADALYRDNKLIEAESLYLKAQQNPYFDYKEKEVNQRLQELAPITKMKSVLSSISQSSRQAAKQGDYEKLLQTYNKFQQANSTKVEAPERYAPFYDQISQDLRLTPSFKTYFQQFKDQFLAQAEQNLTKSQFTSESFKRNLLLIPDDLLGDDKDFQAEIIDTFKSYDEKKLDKLASKGDFAELYKAVLSMVAEYNTLQVQNEWLTTATDKITLDALKINMENNNYRSFVITAKQYESFISSASHTGSTVTKFITNNYDNLMSTAKKMTSTHNYQQALEIYDQVGSYRDIADIIQEVKLAWTRNDPTRLLPEIKDNYAFLQGGVDRFGSQVYIAAINRTNAVQFARMNALDAIQILTYSQMLQSQKISSMAIDPVLSSPSQPVLLIQAESSNRNTTYTALAVHNEEIVPIFVIEADELTVNQDGTLTVINPVGEGAGQTAIYVRQGDTYQFAKVEIKIQVQDIDGSKLADYSDTKVRFLCTVLIPGSGSALAYVGDAYMMLSGNFDFAEGDVTVTGTFTQFTDTDLSGVPQKIPVLEVDAVNDSNLSQ